MKRLKNAVHWLVCKWPLGYFCDFELESKMPGKGSTRIRLTKTLFVIVGDKKRDGSIDALPVNFVAPDLQKRILHEVESKWYWPQQPKRET